MKKSTLVRVAITVIIALMVNKITGTNALESWEWWVVFAPVMLLLELYTNLVRAEK